MTETLEDTVIGEYRLIHPLGEGGMGSVWLAEHRVLGKRFAIKFLLADNANNPDLRARFEQEARTIGRLDHPNVVAAANFGFTPDGCPYLVMEALRGQSLRALLDQVLGTTNRPLTAARAIALIRQACAGIAHAHDCGVVHRDLKPENLFVIQTVAGADQVKVLDFGIAKIRSATGPMAHKTQTGVILGTPYYMSYEQARGESDIDFRSDIYSLAAILYELVSGNRPHDGDQYNAIITDIVTRDAAPLDEAALGLPAGLSAVLLRGMARDRAIRYQSIAEFDEALRNLVAVPTTDANARVPTPVETTGAVNTIYVPTPAQPSSNAAPIQSSSEANVDSLDPATHDPPQHSPKQRARFRVALAVAFLALASLVLILQRVRPFQTELPRASTSAVLGGVSTESPAVVARAVSALPSGNATDSSSTTPATVSVDVMAPAANTLTSAAPAVIPVASPSPSGTGASSGSPGMGRSVVPNRTASMATTPPASVGAVKPASANQPNRSTTAGGATGGLKKTDIQVKIPKNPY